MKKEYILDVNGFKTVAAYDERAVNEIFLPLLRYWTELRRKSGRRIIAFLCAPPGAGKTTLSLLLEQLSHEHDELEDIQSVGLDGFHYRSEYIASHTVTVDGIELPMKRVKGSPETFDVAALTKRLELMKTENVMWPIYDRNIHDVSEAAVEVTQSIVLLEGNWLLYTEPSWAELIDYCDDSVFIYAGHELLRERLIERKVRGGLSRAAAEEFYLGSDSKNVDRLLKHHHRARLELTMTGDGEYM